MEHQQQLVRLAFRVSGLGSAATPWPLCSLAHRGMQCRAGLRDLQNARAYRIISSLSAAHSDPFPAHKLPRAACLSQHQYIPGATCASSAEGKHHQGCQPALGACHRLTPHAAFPHAEAPDPTFPQHLPGDVFDDAQRGYVV